MIVSRPGLDAMRRGRLHRLLAASPSGPVPHVVLSPDGELSSWRDVAYTVSGVLWLHGYELGDAVVPRTPSIDLYGGNLHKIRVVCERGHGLCPRPQASQLSRGTRVPASNPSRRLDKNIKTHVHYAGRLGHLPGPATMHPPPPFMAYM